jgi:hypothetical protein
MNKIPIATKQACMDELLQGASERKGSIFCTTRRTLETASREATTLCLLTRK